MVCVCVFFGGESSGLAFVQYMSIKGLIEGRGGSCGFPDGVCVCVDLLALY